MAKEHAIKAAQEELPRMGAQGVVVDVQRRGHDAIVVLDDRSTIAVSGLLAVKLIKLLTSRYLRNWPLRSSVSIRGNVEVDPGGFIRARFQEDATIADWWGAYKLHARLVQDTAIRLTLVDLRKQKSSAPIAALFDFGISIPKDVRFAVLAKPRDDHVFVETVARNRGAKARLFFGAEEEAVRWLLSG